MIYKEFKGKKLSALGLGCMRLPTVLGIDSKINEKRTAEMVQYAFANGINYFDTAWGYHSGKSEPVMGKILKSYPRNSFYLATKFPGYDLKNMGKAEEIFAKQLERCQVEYFDFYLVHSLCDSNIDAYLDNEKKYGDIEYLIKEREKGRIKHLGFSTHANLNDLSRFLERYGEEMEFCQVQLNYLDWSAQNAKGQLELLKKYNLPIWVMEPVRGGKLAKLEGKYSSALSELRPEETDVSWAFRFLQSLDDVVVTLSGMSDYEQLRENIETFNTEKPLNKAEWHTLMRIADNMQKKEALPCTRCRYCTSYCPKEIDIPRIIELYNEYCFNDKPSPLSSSDEEEARASQSCIACRKCEEVCPQKIRISNMMSDFSMRF